MSKLFLTACLQSENSNFSHLPHEKFLERKNSSKKYVISSFARLKVNNNVTISIKFTVTKLGKFSTFPSGGLHRRRRSWKLENCWWEGKHILCIPKFSERRKWSSLDEFFSCFLGWSKNNKINIYFHRMFNIIIYLMNFMNLSKFESRTASLRTVSLAGPGSATGPCLKEIKIKYWENHYHLIFLLQNKWRVRGIGIKRFISKEIRMMEKKRENEENSQLLPDFPRENLISLFLQWKKLRASPVRWKKMKM